MSGEGNFLSALLGEKDKKKKTDLMSNDMLIGGTGGIMDVGFNEAPVNAQIQDLSGVGVAANADAGGVQGIGGSIPMTPAEQAQAGVTDAKTGPDWKGMAKGLGEGLTAYQKAQAPIKAQGLYQQAQAPQQMPMGVAQNQTANMPQGVSGAMQAIMQGIPEQQRKMGILGMLGR